MATILVNTPNPIEVITAVTPILYEELTVPTYLINYEGLNLDRLKRSFDDVEEDCLRGYVLRMKADGGLYKQFLADIHPIDTTRTQLKLIFGDFTEKEWRDLRLLGAIMVGGGHMEYCEEYTDVDVTPSADDTFAYQLSNIIQIFLESDLHYRVPNARRALQRQLRKGLHI